MATKKSRVLKFGFTLMLMILCGVCAQTSAADADGGEGFFDMSIEELMDVEVYGASKYKQKVSDAPSSISIVTADDIQTYGYRTLAEILRSLRGFYTTYDRNYNYLGVRGFGRPGDYNSRILLLVDGRKVNDNVYESAAIGTDFLVDVDLIDRVEVIRGPGSSLYGSSAFFAVVNVITKNPTDYNGVEVSGEISKWETYKERVTYGTKLDNGIEAMVSYTDYKSEGDDHYYREFAGEPSAGWARDADGERSRSFFAKFIWGDWTFETAYVHRDKNAPTGAWYDAGILFNDNRTMTSDRTGFFDLKYDHEFENELGFMARFFYGWYNYDGDYVYDDTPPYINDDYLRSAWYGTELQFTKQLNEKHKAVFGFEYQDDQRQDQGNQDIYGVYLDDKRESERWGIFVQDEYKFSDVLTFNIGARYDNYNLAGGSMSPRLAMIYDVDDDTVLKLMYGQAFRAPAYYELFYNDDGYSALANPDLEPETIETYEMVLEKQFNKNIKGTASAFLYKIRNLISSVDTGGGVTQFQNSDRVNAEGLEFELHGVWDNGWETTTSYTIVNTEDTATRKGLTNTPKHMFKANLKVPVAEKIFAGLEVQYESERMTLAGNRSGDFALVNMTVTHTDIVKNLDVSVGLYNLLDEEYGNPGFSEHKQDVLNQDGINFRVKLTYRF